MTAGNARRSATAPRRRWSCTADKADELGLKPLAAFRAFATAGVDPAIMGIGPVPAVHKLLGQDRPHDVATSIWSSSTRRSPASRCTCSAQLEIPDDKLNVNGGAIALGHPLGCTGAKLTATALYELKRRGGRYAIVTMCIGGGQGAAGLFERL